MRFVHSLHHKEDITLFFEVCSFSIVISHQHYTAGIAIFTPSHIRGSTFDFDTFQENIDFNLIKGQEHNLFSFVSFSILIMSQKRMDT